MRIRPIHIVLVLAILPFFSCQKELSYEGGHPYLPGNFMATIDGVQWIASDSMEGGTILGGLINIAGTSSDNKQLSITLSDTVTGVYRLNQSSPSQGAYANHDSSDIYAFTTDQGADTTQAGGIVTVTAIDKVGKTISGTFSFKVYRDIDGRGKTITQGVFNKLPYVSSLPVANTGDTMRCTINGSAWIAQSIEASILAPQLAINGSDLNGARSVSLIFPLNTAPGSYPLSISGRNYFGIYTPTAITSLSSDSGTLVILENDPVKRRIRGNFQFEASYPGLNATTDQLTNGYFSVIYH